MSGKENRSTFVTFKVQMYIIIFISFSDATGILYIPDSYSL